MPPYIVYKGTDNSMPCSWLLNGPKGAGYATTKNGWMDAERFEAYIPWLNDQLTNLEIKKPVIMFLDGYSSHLTYKCVRTAKEMDIILVKLPPNSTHLLQVLDVSVFKPAKTNWTKIVKSWFRQTRFQTVSKSVFPTLLNKLFDTLVEKPDYLINGFRATGIWPLNKELVLQKIESRGIYKAAVSYTKHDESESDSGAVTQLVTSSPAIKEPIKITNSYSSTPRVPKTPLVTKSRQQHDILSPSTRALANAVRRTLTPEQDELTKKGIENNKLKLIKVKKNKASILTEADALAEIKSREEEKEKKKKRGPAKKKSRDEEKEKLKGKKKRVPARADDSTDSDEDFSALLKKKGTARVGKLQTSAVYTDMSDASSDSDKDSGSTQMQTADTEADVGQVEIQTNETIDYYIGTVNVGSYILSKFEGNQGKFYVYVCRIRENKDPLFEVQGLKSMNNEKTLFLQKDNDISLIGRSDIIKVIPNPTPITVKRKILYKFASPLEVNEC